jgi:hypothetical protein
MAKALVLDSLEIQRFKCFKNLRIEHLGRVNLIVGKNNVGKSTLLEALRLFARPASIDDLLEILASRNEVFVSEFDDLNRDPNYSPSVDSLFFGRQAMMGDQGAITIGPADSPEQVLKIQIDIQNDHIKATFSKTDQVDASDSGNVRQSMFWRRDTILSFRIGSASQGFIIARPTIYRLASDPGNSIIPSADSVSLAAPLRRIPSYTVGANGLGLYDIGKLWDNVSLSPLEQDVIDAVNVISPDIDRIALKTLNDRSNGKSSGATALTRIPFAKVESSEEPIPLGSLGGGVNRLFGIALALAHAKGGVLLVDEIENGIHYSVQPDVWRLVFETATRLNVQVFATTHSYDCIRAFEAAASASEEEGVLVRLARKGDRTLVGEFDESELGIAVEGQIEVR